MFERMLDVIRDEGYVGCALADALRSPSPRRVAITFDDGTWGQFAYAAPALRARGMTATIYVTTDWVGRPGYMSWDDLRQIADQGISIQSHTRSHPFLSELDATRLRAELEESKAALDRELRQDTSEIALPGGDAPGRSLRHLIGDAGYRVVATSRWGMNQGVDSSDRSPRWIRRCTVRGDITREMACRFIAGDRWLALARRPREAALGGIRSGLGPTRYARWRRRLLDFVSRPSSSEPATPARP